MHPSVAILSSLLLTATASLAQTGFTTQTFPTHSPQGTNLLVADFNRDGRPDLLALDGTIFFNDGSGGFGAQVALPGTGTFFRAQVGALKGDGVPDIVACVQDNSGVTSVTNLVTYLNDGTGKFTIGQTIALPQGCTSIALGDANSDGHLDVVVATYSSTVVNNVTVIDNSFQTFFGDGTGKLGAPFIQQNVNLDDPSSSYGTTSCMVDDIIGGNFYLNGTFTLMVNSFCPSGQPYDPGTTFLAESNGNGQYTFTNIRSGIGSLIDGHASDVLKNGRPDGVFVDSAGSHSVDSVMYLQNNGGGSFSESSFGYQLAGSNPPSVVDYSGVTVGDFNGDGFNDIAASLDVLATIYYINTPAIAIFNGSGTGTFNQSQLWTLAAYDSIGNIVSADFNGDGKTDLATLVTEGANNVTNLYVYTNSPGTSSCAVPANTNTSIICQPAKSATVSSPVRITAASNVVGFTLNRLYLDNVAVYQSTAQSIDTSITAAPGPHTLVLVSYTANSAITATSTFTVASTGCIPTTAGVDICAPTAGSTDNSPVTITAGALAQTGNISAIRAYIDNIAVLTVNNPSASTSFQISQAVPANPGTHNLVVVGYESTGGALTRSESFTINTTSPCYPSSAGAEICSPAPSVITSSPISVVAGATAGSGYLTAIRVYVDNIAQALLYNPQQSKSFAINSSIALSKGAHTLVVVGYQSTGGSVSTRESITIQ